MTDEEIGRQEVGVGECVSDREFLLVEYASIIQKMNGDVAWAAAFVGLYFAFLVSICAGMGYLFFAEAFQNGTADATMLFARKFAIFTGAVFGVALNSWAIGMVFDYKRTAKVNLRRASEIESFFLSRNEAGIGRRTLGHSTAKGWTVLTLIVVGSVMVMMFAPWVIAIYVSMYR